MAHFIGNDSVTFNSEKIIKINWNCLGEDKLSRAEVYLEENHCIYLYYIKDEDYELINNLINDFGYELLPRVK
ncbi:MAG: hypothetical protein KME28_27510 [Pelatocladus maniniholoensis HA4357-MV3]|jgi:hypothetical protein|uniref:Uncharacterized protein n=1 Tax=Pelatocladus maniniholoensis HA4357-MV3 TaxID=1117104 RepID=A0A9E3HFH0_9NOST|nr:hypothetical protein [Pelatocladus maniniholoensis HA4357-MV3]